MKQLDSIVGILAVAILVLVSQSLFAALFVYKVITPPANKGDVVKRCATIMEKSGVKSFTAERMKPVEDRMVLYGKDIEVSINNLVGACDIRLDPAYDSACIQTQTYTIR